jgi:acylphosphatase
MDCWRLAPAASRTQVRPLWDGYAPPDGQLFSAAPQGARGGAQPRSIKPAALAAALYFRLHFPMRLGRHYLVTGRVQGVGFRYFTLTAAVREGLHGWVRNAAEGGVEISAEGEREALDRFEHAVRRGPPAARVEQVEVTDVGAGGRNTGFEVRE